MKVPIREILRYLKEKNIQFTFNGNKNTCVDGVTNFDNPADRKITWIKNEKQTDWLYYSQLKNMLLICTDYLAVFTKLDNHMVIVTPEARKVYLMIIQEFFKNDIEPECTYVRPKKKTLMDISIWKRM